MRRMERRMYKRRRGKATLRWAVLLVLLTAAVGLYRLRGGVQMTADALHEPTATPVTADYDQQVVTREVTLEELNWYAVQTGVFSSGKAAEEKANAYTDRGAPGYVLQDGEKWRVLIACYGEKADASSVRERLSTVQQVETYLYEWHCPQLRLRMSGKAGQLDTVEAGLLMMRQTAERLREASVFLDSGEYTLNEAVAALESLQEETTLWTEVARSRFSAPRPDLVERLLQWSQTVKESLAMLGKTSGEGASALSAALKQQAMALYEQQIRFREQLNAS